MKKIFIVCSCIVALVAIMAFNAMATPILGDISFTGSGTYPVSLLGEKVTLSSFSFDSPVLPIAPRWKFTTGAVTYSFDAAELTIILSRDANLISVCGIGIAYISA